MQKKTLKMALLIQTLKRKTTKVPCESFQNKTTLKNPVLLKALKKINRNEPENSRPHKSFEMKNF